MAIKGTMAKTEVINVIAKAFGDNYIGEVDRKIYVWANDGPNGKVQIAIGLTCPKNPIGDVPAATSGEGHDWSSVNTPIESAKPAEISAEEEASIAEMMKRLGL